MRWLTGLRAALLTERDRWPLWLPVALGAGIAVYFALAAEPWPWLGLVLCAGGAGALALVRRHPPARVAGLGAVAGAFGFALAQAHTLLVAGVLVPDSERPGLVEGRVVYAEPWKNGVRVLLDRLTIERLAPAATPQRVRIVAQGWHVPPPRPGTRVRLLAVLGPPPGPVAPGAFDFARQAWFERLGGTGFALGAGEVVAPPAGDEGVRFRLAGVRSDLSERVRAALPGATGAVAAALLTGERAAIPEPVNQAMRDSGLFHLLSISGLHLSLVAGFVFFGTRAALALIEPLALRAPIKKWAAFVAIVATAAYLGLSGASVPTQRAFLMTTVGLAAIMLDRSPFSMRLVAVAAVAVLIGAPDSLLGASFQLSFAAVVALIAFFEAAAEHGWLAVGNAGWARRAWVYLAGVALTSLIAGTATAPFAAYHFDRVSSYGVIANMIAVPVTGAWVMPWGLAALVLAPLGLERLALAPVGWGIDAILATARTVAAWPGASLAVPAAPLASLVAVTVGGLWLCLWRGGLRWLGLAGFVAAAAAWSLATPPDVLIDGEARIVGLRGPDGRWAVSSARAARQSAETWLRRAGQTSWAPWPAPGEETAWLACDGVGCVTRAARIAVVFDPIALADDCGRAAVIVLLAEGHARCAGTLVIDRRLLARSGAVALWLTESGLRIETVAAARGDRPWTRVPRPQYVRNSPTSRP